MPELTGIPGLPGIHLPVHDDSHAEAPVHIDHEHVPRPGPGTLDVFAHRHGAGVVVQRGRDAHLLLQAPGERFSGFVEPGVTVAGPVVDAARHGQAGPLDLATLLPGEGDDFPEDVAEPDEGPLGVEDEIFEDPLSVHVPLEIHEARVDVAVIHVHAEEPSGIGPEAVPVRTPSGDGFRLAAVFQGALLQEDAHVFGGCADADSQRFRDLGNRGPVPAGQQGQDLTFRGVHQVQLSDSGAKISNIMEI